MLPVTKHSDPTILVDIFMNASKYIDVNKNKTYFTFETPSGSSYLCKTKRTFWSPISSEHYRVMLPNESCYSEDLEDINCFDPITQWVKDYFGAKKLKVNISYIREFGRTQLTYRSGVDFVIIMFSNQVPINKLFEDENFIDI